MKKTITILSALLFLSMAAFGQVSMIPTTLSASVDSQTRTVVVAAATGLNSNSYSIAAHTSYLYVDGEYMSVNSVNGTTLGVTRGYGGTRAASHNSGALVFVGPANFFGQSPGQLPQGSCTRTNITALPRPEILASVVSDCLGGVWVYGQANNLFGLAFTYPPTGAVALTGVGTGSAGTAVTPNTTFFCSEIDLTNSRLLTGMAVLNGGTAATDKWIYYLFDSTGKPLAHTSLSGTTASGTNVYQQIAFTSKYYAVGPNRYFGCLNGNAAGSSTATMIKTGMQDVNVAGAVTSQTFGTAPSSITVPTTFTTAVGPYWELY